MGKTGTTAMQHLYFPKVARALDLEYNPREIYDSLIYISNFAFTKEQKNIIQTRLPERFLISLESLFNWNSSQWEATADELLEAFGSETHIIISLRDPEKLFKSIYLQFLQEGNYCKPSEFFISNNTFASISKQIRPGIFEFVNVDTFDYQHLYEIYHSRFNNVSLLNNEMGVENKAIEKIFCIDSSVFETSNKKTKNKSYSEMSVKLTTLKYKVLKRLGVVELGTSKEHPVSRLNRVNNQYFNPYKKEKSNRDIRLFRWRTINQNIISKVFSKPFSFPANLYLNKELIAKNRTFLSEIGSFRE